MSICPLIKAVSAIPVGLNLKYDKHACIVDKEILQDKLQCVTSYMLLMCISSERYLS